MIGAECPELDDTTKIVLLFSSDETASDGGLQLSSSMAASTRFVVSSFTNPV